MRIIDSFSFVCTWHWIISPSEAWQSGLLHQEQWEVMRAFLQWSSGPCYLFGLGHDHRHHQLLHLYDVRVTVHQSHACPHAAGTKFRLHGWMWAGIDWKDVILPVCCVSDWGVCVCDFYEHRTQSENNGRRTLLHPNSCHQRLWRGHGYLHLSCKTYHPVYRHALSKGCFIFI